MLTYYVQTDETGDWVEGYTMWGSDGSRHICDTLQEVEDVARESRGNWVWLSLDDARVHWTRQPAWKDEIAVSVKFWDERHRKHSTRNLSIKAKTPWYRPLSLT